jgi:uncharacterized protein (TIGR00255 family)
MALTSMTGFARAEGADEGLSWHWELRSVNGKGLDLRIRLPAGFEELEARIRQLAPNYLRRGNCQINLWVDVTRADPVITVNERALEAILAAVEKLNGRVSSEPPRIEALLSLRGVLEVSEQSSNGTATPEQLDRLTASFTEALAKMVAARRDEGAKLARVLHGHIDRIEALTIAARDCPARSPEAIKVRLREQIERLFEVGNFDDQRLHQEAMLIAARADIREELDRLFAHVAQARQLLAEGTGVGRKLDFLAQEFNREANTLCSKSNDTSLTAIGLELKVVIDQLREQVQNIE